MNRSNLVQSDVNAVEDSVSLAYFNCQYGWHENCSYLDYPVLDPERACSIKS